MLRTAGWWSGGLAVVGSLVVIPLWGLGAVPSYLAGVAVVVVFFLSGMLGVRAVLRRDPAMAMAGAGAVYVLQLSVAFGLVIVGQMASWIVPNALAAGAVLETIVWQAGLVHGLSHSRQLVYDDTPTWKGEPSS